MKLNEVIAKYGNQEVDESKIKEVLGVNKSKVWKPEKNDKVWILAGDGKVINPNPFHIDENYSYYLYGNCFETKEEAEFARDKQIFLTKFERYLRENEDEPVDWNNTNKNNFTIRLDHCDDYKTILIVSWRSLQQQGAIYTTNKLVLQKFVEDNEADIKKYMFGIG